MPERPRVAILAEGLLTRQTAKTAIGVIRYAPFPVVAVVDSTRAGTDAADAIGIGNGIPVIATIDEAIGRGATVVLIGTAAPGGRINDTFRPMLAEALAKGLEVWNGLHERVLADPALRVAAERGGGRVRELREAPADLPIGGHRLRRVGTRVALTVGSDAAVGKMTVALELVRALERAGERTAFVATGQTGIAIPGSPASPSACCTGAPPTSSCSATTPLARRSKAFPASHCDRSASSSPSTRAPRRGAGPPARVPVVAVALNTSALDEAAARRAVDAAAAETGLPVADPVRDGERGADRLAAAVLG